MKLPHIIPGPSSIIREGLIVLGGAILAAYVVGNVPGLKAWIKAQWASDPRAQI